MVQILLPTGESSGILSGNQARVFQLMQTTAMGNTETGRIIFPPSSLPTGSTASVKLLDQPGLPAALGTGVTYLGPAFTVSATLTYTLPEGASVPAGQKLAVKFYDTATSSWVDVASNFWGDVVTFTLTSRARM